MKSIAEKKQQQNIGEYIIYMYQMEDLLRAFNFVLEDIEQYVVSHYPVELVEKKETVTWFADLATQMQEEKITQKGHLQAVQAIVDELARLHWSLLKTDKSYFEHYQLAKPHVLHMMLEEGADEISHEVQLFFNAIYGRLLARLQGREIPSEILEATESFGGLLSYLNEVYMHSKN
ncbi:DUF4924 family protein [Mongoliitalea lutea]|uniref:DUF4924 domain-containing protein n=1 Tax=Mongoliitalea lutea TaxID=849756 RepID=A0A8J3G645_9BACT|nr:DUF4924 family protein [Mongoliitalea lutea]GHB42573.1 hypothetical protein GCM10008106_24460 [Mongoliitalea lutea]